MLTSFNLRNNSKFDYPGRFEYFSNQVSSILISGNRRKFFSEGICGIGGNYFDTKLH